MLMAPAAALPLKLLAAIKPTAAVLLVERVGSDALRTLGGTTMAYACLSDLYQGEAYTAALGRLNSAAGLGIVAAPLLASAVAARGGTSRRVFVVSAALAAVHLVVGRRVLIETVGHPGSVVAPPRAHQRAVEEKPKLIQPVWRFLRLFTTNARLRLRAYLFTMHCLVEGKVLQDQVSVLQLGLGWSTGMRSRWTSGLGLAILLGGQAAGTLIAKLGVHKFTAACHAASLIAFIGFRQTSFWASLCFLCLGQQRRSASSSWLVAEACRAGIGRGEVVGWIASLRAAVDFVSAVVYGALFRSVTARGRPFDVFLLPASVAVLAEILRLRITFEEEPRRCSEEEVRGVKT